MSELIERIIPRLSDDERRVLSLPFIQLATLETTMGLCVDKHHKVPASTFRSLRSRGIALGGPNPKTRIMPLSPFGIAVAERVRELEWVEC